MTKRGDEPAEPSLPSTRPKSGDDEARPVFEPVLQDETSGVSAFFGIWPGDETDAELLRLLAELDD